MIFFNCALAGSAQAFFDGTQPSLGQGIGQAASRAPAILLWAVICSTVGLFLRWLDELAGLIGRIAIALLGMAWSLTAFLIVPVLVIENRGTPESIRRSGELLRKTWGEQRCTGIVFGWAGLLFAIPGVVIGAIGMNGFAPLIPVAVLYVIALAVAFSAARQIFAVALYRYATTGEPPEGYTAAGLQGAIRPR
jgi:hypothetical protein